jgi:hypothetical protein
VTPGIGRIHPKEESENTPHVRWLNKLTNVFNGLLNLEDSWHGLCIDKIKMGPAEVGSGKNKAKKIMKTIRYLILTGITVASLYGPRTVWAQASATPPVVVVPNDGNLGGVPENIKVLILDFAITRDKYLAEQNLLLIKLSKATTPEEREQIREQLQDNRQAFLEALKDFREQLKDELEALKGKISHEEFLRIIQLARDAATEGGFYHHKGH